jgi:DNA modification methylase
MTHRSAAVVKIEQVDIESLQPDAANPRRMSDAEMESLTRSIQQFGLVDPVIAKREDNAVIGGHQRLLAARRLGMKKVPVIFLDIPKEEARLLNLALNRISGTWDDELLARLLSDLDQSPDVDLSLSGFDDDEIKKLLKTLDLREKRDRPESFDLDAALEESQRSPRCTPGNVWQLGDHRVMCGDSTDPAQVAVLTADTKASMAFTDPPYNVDYGDHGGMRRKGRKRKIANDALSAEQWETFVHGWAENLLQFVDGSLYICMSTREWPTVSKVLIESGAHWSDTIIWAKDRFTLGRADYQRMYEPIWYGWREGTKHRWCGDRDQGDVWRIERPSDNDLHPTMKPLELIERAIANSSEVGDIALDLFLGSGSTLIAAERTGRVCYGMEIDPHYCDIVLMRWEAFTGERACRLSGNAASKSKGK